MTAAEPPRDPQAASPDDEFRVLRMKGSYEAFGILIDYLAKIEPFARFDLGNFAVALQRQLQDGHHLAALLKREMIGYCGWLLTTEKIAAAWQNDEGPLTPSGPGEPANAAVLTVVAARDKAVLTALIREARRLNPGKRVYFKRDYEGTGRRPRKSAVRNIEQ